jgi:hypothetical protein
VLNRVFRALKLDADLYEEVEHDSQYLPEAALIVVATSLLAGFGGWISGSFVAGFISLALTGLLGWFVWSGVTLIVGTRIFGGTANYGEMLRVLGYANAPFALAIVPWVGLLVGSLWALVASIVALRQGLDFTLGKAIGTAIVGWIVLFIVRAVVISIF